MIPNRSFPNHLYDSTQQVYSASLKRTPDVFNAVPESGRTAHSSKAGSSTAVKLEQAPTPTMLSSERNRAVRNMLPVQANVLMLQSASAQPDKEEMERGLYGLSHSELGLFLMQRAMDMNTCGMRHMGGLDNASVAKEFKKSASNLEPEEIFTAIKNATEEALLNLKKDNDSESHPSLNISQLANDELRERQAARNRVRTYQEMRTILPRLNSDDLRSFVNGAPLPLLAYIISETEFSPHVRQMAINEIKQRRASGTLPTFKGISSETLAQE